MNFLNALYIALLIVKFDSLHSSYTYFCKENMLFANFFTYSFAKWSVQNQEQLPELSYCFVISDLRSVVHLRETFVSK